MDFICALLQKNQNKNSELGINSVDGNKEGIKEGEGGCGGVPSIEPNQNTTMEG